MVLKRLALFILLFFVTAFPVFAGGGRMSIASSELEEIAGNGIEVQVRINKEGSTDQLSVGERAEFMVKNPRSGDKCDTQGGITDGNGIIKGNCSAATPGTITIYVRSIDNGDNSSDYLLYFVVKPTNTPTPTLAPTSKANILPTPEKTPSPTKKPKPTRKPTPTDEPKVAGSTSNPLLPIGALALAVIASISAWIFLKKRGSDKLKKISVEPKEEDRSESEVESNNQ